MTWFRYVPLARVGEWLARGWTVADDLTGTHHGRYAVLMQWTGTDEPA